MPYTALGGVALVGNPYVGLESLELVVLGHFFGVAHDLQDHDIVALGKDKAFFLPQRGVEGLVQLVAILGDELVFHQAQGDFVKAVLLHKMLQDLGLDPDKVAPDIRGLDRRGREDPASP